MHLPISWSPGFRRSFELPSALLESAALTPVLIAALTLRIAALPQRGLIYWDEGKFALEGLRVLAALHALVTGQSLTLSGKAIGTAKPTHALLIALAYVILGVHDYSPLSMSAVMSAGEVVLLFLLTRRLFGPIAALLAALFLAVSGYDVIYARSALSESDATLFFLAGVYVWSRNITPEGAHIPGQPLAARNRLLSGLLLGLAFTTNYRLIVYIAVLVALDVTLVVRRDGWRRGAVDITFWSGGLAVCPMTWVIIDLVTRANGLTLFRSELTHRPMSYLSQILYQLHGGRQSVVQLDPQLYIRWFLIRQGWPMFLLVITGLAWSVTSRSACWIVPATLVVGPFIFFSFAAIIVPRNLDTALPFTCLIAAATLVRLARAFPRSRAAPVAMGAITLLATWYCGTLSWRFTAERSGFVRAVAYVHQHASENALIANEVLRFYLRDSGTSCDAPLIPTSVSALATADRFGNEYVILDRFGSQVARYLVTHTRPAAYFLAAGSLSLGENPIASEDGYVPSDTRSQYVNVYSLEGLRLSGSSPRSVPVCSLDRLG